jgi:HEAT repeat protein
MDEQQRLQSPDAEHRTSAAEALSLMGPEAAFAAVELVRACADSAATVREYSVAALEQLGPPSAQSLQQLCGLVRAEDPLVAYWAITLLGRAGTSAQLGEADLVAVLTTSTENSLQERAAWALGKIAARSEAATGALQQAASSSAARLSRLSRASLEKIEA